MFSSRKKKHSPNSAPANALASRSHLTRQQLQFPTKSQSQSHSQSHQQTQQSQPLYPSQWSAHTPLLVSGKWPSPFPRDFHALSTTVTAAGELFLFGGSVSRTRSPGNDLYVISTHDFSTTLLPTSGDVPSPRVGHRLVLTSTTLLIWGGWAVVSDQNVQSRRLVRSHDDSLYLLNLGTLYLFHVKTRSS
jgi:hypothetical protein